MSEQERWPTWRKQFALARQAVDSTPVDHPDRAGRLGSLGSKLQRRYGRTRDLADLEGASSRLHAAWCCQVAIPFYRVQAAARCLPLLVIQSKVDRAIQLNYAVLDLLPAVNNKLMDRSDQQFVMSTFAGTVASLCASLLGTGQSASVLESLERGLAVIVGQLVDGRDDLLLGYAHRGARITKSTQVSLLIAAIPTTPNTALHPDIGKPCDLPGVIIEAKRVKELVTGKVPVQSLTLPCVTQVVDKMRGCSIAHFACHGPTDHVDPSNSGLILQRQDEQGLKQDRLTVQQVSELSLAGGHIAYLSACSTAENKAARLSDEVIHVVSGFQVAGFPHVVGCLWPSIDRVCVEVADGFYQSLLRRRSWDGQAVACAVREAVTAVREADMDAPLVWAQFVHFGA